MQLNERHLQHTNKQRVIKSNLAEESGSDIE